jgi:glucose-6-phosphate 1-dehydrogenase
VRCSTSIPHSARFADATARRDPQNGTETFAEVELELDGPRWAGTRFRLRSGKALARDRQEVVVRFGGGRDPLRLPLNEESDPSELPAYGRILLDALRGDATLSVRADEAEEAWRVFTPVLDGWARGLRPLEEYDAGSQGP